MATATLSPEQITAALKNLPGWQFSENSIRKTYEFDQYLAGLAFATAAGTVAEGRDHHPDMTVGWRKVTLTFTTHDAGSKVTQKDIDAATAIEALGYPK